jgi:hypothetical protein
MDEVDNVWNKLSRAMQEQLPRVTMHGLEKSVREPEKITLKAPASKKFCYVRVIHNTGQSGNKIIYAYPSNNCI